MKEKRTSASDALPRQAPESGDAGRVIVVGAGAGGMLAAGRAAERVARVLLIEKTDGPGKKLLISGKGRCNLTNARELEGFISMFGPNGRFLYGAFHRWFREELLAFLGRYGVATKVERGGRIFPASDDAADIVNALRRYLADNGVDLKTGVRKWHFQFVHHPIWDIDMSSAPLLIDTTVEGRPRKLVAVPSKVSGNWAAR